LKNDIKEKTVVDAQGKLERYRQAGNNELALLQGQQGMNPQMQQ
jgi:hypothetical protein